MNRLATLLIACCLAAAVQAQQEDASVAAERARLGNERARVDAEFKAEEKACYGKFAVNDCLAAAKSKRRQALGDLRRQEIALNDAERKRKAIERRQSIEDKAPTAPAERAPASRPAAEERGLRINERNAAAKAAEREKEVQQRQAENRSEQQRRAEDAAGRAKAQEKRVAEAKEREEKLRKRLAERKKPPASSLKDPS